MRFEAGDMVVRNQTSEQPVKLRLDDYDTILLNVHGVFLADYLLQEAAERGCTLILTDSRHMSTSILLPLY